MKTICFFASYFSGNKLPYYISVYLKELKKHFGEVVLLTSHTNLSEKDTDFLRSEGIQIMVEENKGFDFGLWYKAFQRFNVDAYDKIALVNDSCILFKPLDEFIAWSNADKADLQGITISEAVSPHVQSYFLLLNRKAVALTKDYFNTHKILHNISDVIKMYEIGLSWHLISHGLSISSFIDNGGYEGEFSPYYVCVDYHLSSGIPMIKKKILFSSYRKNEFMNLARMGFNIDTEYYYQILKTKSGLIIDLKKLQEENPGHMSRKDVRKFNNTKFWIKLLRPIYRFFKG